MKDFQDYDPTFAPGDGRFIALNLSVGVLVAWFVPGWLHRAALIVAWGVLRTLLSWLRDSHRPFLARVLARGEHGAINPSVAHYLAILIAAIVGGAFGALGGALLRAILFAR